MAWADLGKRVAVAGIGIPVALALVYLGGWPLGIAMAVVAALAAGELYDLSEKKGNRPYRWLGVVAAAGLVLLCTALPVFAQAAPWALAGILLLTFGSLFVGLWLRDPDGSPLADASVTVAGALYVGGGMAFAVLLRELPGEMNLPTDPSPWLGAAFLIFPIAATWLGDSFAYFGGTRWGKRKLAPTISPKKTVVGGVAGLMGAVLAAAILVWIFTSFVPGWHVSPVLMLVAGLFVGATAQVGDLAESVLKRSAGVKDSGDLIPGHGGALDRFDALFFTLPLAYLIFWLGVVQR
jgi:phosphatidate cytidylyltransferase